MGLYEDAVALAHHQFVGREAELARFRDLLDRPDPRVWWVFGPGGIGKSRLLRVLADEAQRSGCEVVLTDHRSSDGWRTELVQAVAEPEQRGGRLVAILDAVESTAGVERWIRHDLLPRVPSRSLVVIGSRRAPSVEWRSHPTWSCILDLLPLRGLSSADGERLLASAGVPHELMPPLIELGHGHPLALQLLADTVAGTECRPVPVDIDQAPDLVAAVLTRMIDDIPDDRHRHAVELTALARVTTRSLLREACGTDHADEVFAWLAARAWIDRVPGGLCPHDLAREVIEADLRNNDPDRYAAALRTIRTHILDPQRFHRDPGRGASDYIYLNRHNSPLRTAWDWSSFGQTDLTDVRPSDRDDLAQLVARTYGSSCIPVLDHWLDRQAHGFTVVRSSTEVIGFIALLGFEEPEADDLAADPSLDVIWRRVLAQGRPRPGEIVGVSRFVCDRVAGSVPPSPTYNAVTLQCMRYWFTSPGLCLDYVIKPRAGLFQPMMDFVDFRRVTDADHSVGTTEMAVFEHNWRDVPLAPWLDRLDLLQSGGRLVPVDPAPVLVALDEDGFAEAVRRALRDLTKPDRLAGNPLVSSRVVRDSPDGEGVDALVQTLRDAFESLDDHPKTERARRAVDRTYLRGAVTQEAAAEVLGMAFSTYRRHLATGIDLLVDRLWRWELYGRAE